MGVVSLACRAFDVKVWQQDSRTDAGQSDHYVPLCFAGDTKSVSPLASFNCYECQWARTLELISTAQLAEKHILNTNQMHLWNRDASRQQKSPNMANIAVLYFDPAPPQGNVMSVKCRKPLDELAVQVWLLYRHANFKYCTLYVSGTKLRTGVPITRCPWRIFQAGGIKTMQIRKHLPGRSKLFLLVNPWVSKAIKLQSVWTSEKD